MSADPLKNILKKGSLVLSAVRRIKHLTIGRIQYHRTGGRIQAADLFQMRIKILYFDKSKMILSVRYGTGNGIDLLSRVIKIIRMGRQDYLFPVGSKSGASREIKFSII